MAGYYRKRALEILQDEGPVELGKQCKEFLYDHMCLNLYHKPMWKMKYGESRPTRKDTLFVDPTRIDYRIRSRYLPNDAPPYGIIGGDWDSNKSHWKNESIFFGLMERFEEEKTWEETVYYQTAIERLENSGKFGALDGPQTVSNFKKYLDELDTLYKDISSNGYDPSSIIAVNIGRDGEWMVHHGNHRHTIARITGVEKVSVRIKYRHKQWQECRHDIYHDGLSEKREDLCDHPDLQNILD